MRTRNKITIDYINSIIKDKGICLSPLYLGAKTNLKWRCNCGYEWEVAPLNILYNNTWCPKCGLESNKQKHTKYTIEDMQNFAASKNGLCLSHEFINLSTNLTWKCNICGKVWDAIPNSIINFGYWCRVCHNNKRKNKIRYSLDDLNKIASKFNGAAISKTANNIETIIKWKCSSNHVFEKKLKYVLENRWCDKCKFTREKIYRTCIEQKLNIKLDKVKPKWLIGDKGRCLELDMYNENLKLAFEYNGKQHYDKIDFMKIDNDNVKRTKTRDKLKAQLCKENNVKLIVVKYGKTNIEEDVKSLLKKNNLLPNNYDDIVVNYIDCNSNDEIERYDKIKRTVESKGGELLTKGYLGHDYKYKIKCSNGHIFYKDYYKIVHNSWCVGCFGKKKKTIKYVIAAGEKVGLIFKDNFYKDAHFKHNWECNKCGSSLILSLNRIMFCKKKSLCNVCKHRM